MCVCGGVCKYEAGNKYRLELLSIRRGITVGGSKYEAGNNWE